MQVPRTPYTDVKLSALFIYFWRRGGGEGATTLGLLILISMRCQCVDTPMRTEPFPSLYCSMLAQELWTAWDLSPFSCAGSPSYFLPQLFFLRLSIFCNPFFSLRAYNHSGNFPGLSTFLPSWPVRRTVLLDCVSVVQWTAPTLKSTSLV